MPWKVEKREGKHCVIKESDGSVEGCHDTEGEAMAQMRALYASENKDKCMDGMGGMMPMGMDLTATSFAELDAAETARESAMEVSESAATFHQLVSNILNSPFVEDKPGALRSLASEFADRVDAAMKAKEKEAPRSLLKETDPLTAYYRFVELGIIRD